MSTKAETSGMGLSLMAVGAVDGWRTPLLALLATLVVATWVAALVNIVRSRFRSARARWGWIVIVTFIPLVGFLLYWAVGSRYKRRP